MNNTQAGDFLHTSSFPQGKENVEEHFLAKEYVVNHGKSGAIGLFTAAGDIHFHRGDRVVIAGARGLEMGEVLCSAGERHMRMLGQAPRGRLLRPAQPDDETNLKMSRQAGQRLLKESGEVARQLSLPLEILDVDMLLDGTAILQFIGPATVDTEPLFNALKKCFPEIRLENLGLPVVKEGESKGCGQPDCGRIPGGSGCTSCSSGGGCSSCGSGKVDMRAYFAHLREEMEARKRTPLL